MFVVYKVIVVWFCHPRTTDTSPASTGSYVFITHPQPSALSVFSVGTLNMTVSIPTNIFEMASDPAATDQQIVFQTLLNQFCMFGNYNCNYKSYCFSCKRSDPNHFFSKIAYQKSNPKSAAFLNKNFYIFCYSYFANKTKLISSYFIYNPFYWHSLPVVVEYL